MKQFTPREMQILPLLSDTNKIIARKTGISEATVKVHVKSILRTLGMNRRAEAAVWYAMQQHLPKASIWTVGSLPPAEIWD
jgi:two-component system nitrate/nitrite response regulator NarL